MAHPFLKPSAMSSKTDGDLTTSNRCFSELISSRSVYIPCMIYNRWFFFFRSKELIATPRTECKPTRRKYPYLVYMNSLALVKVFRDLVHICRQITAYIASL
jgi:hypothetical protein